MSLLLLLLPVGGEGQQPKAAVLERTGDLNNRRLSETSGVAVSRRHPGVLWTLNDSGNPPIIYAIDMAGQLLAGYRVTNVSERDWEDIATAPCAGAQREWCIYIGDVGDNSEKRRHVSIYMIPEPDLIPSDAILNTAQARELEIRYADGPHDAEAMAVDPHGNVTIITKGRRGPVLRYWISHAAFDSGSVVVSPADTMDIVPEFPLGRVVTGASISPSGARAVVRTYTELYLFKYGNRGTLTHDRPPCWLGAAEPQGEGVAFVTEDTLVLTSESLAGHKGTVYKALCPKPGPPKAP